MKVNDQIFLQIQKPNFLGKSFSKKPGNVMHNLIKVSGTILKFRKKLVTPFQENARTDRRTEGRPQPIS